MISLIGLGLSRNDLTETHLAMIRSADVLAGGARHLAEFPDFSGQTIEIRKNVSGIADMLISLRDQGKRIVVLASGDPLFFGIGSYLISRIGADRIRVYPNISSVAAAFARIGKSWQDARVISCHGRPLDTGVLQEFQIHDTLAVLTDARNTPSRISAALRDHDLTGFQVCVLECLGSPRESLTWFAPEEPVTGTFSEPNLMVFLRKEKKDPVRIFPGMPEARFRHVRGLITKPEIRVISLSQLMLAPDHILWDLGAGCGSVAIEAGCYVTRGKIFAVEKDADRVRDILENRTAFGLTRLRVCHGTLPAAMDDLPDPDRIFIGGGGDDLPAIIRKSAARLRSDGVMVVNTVLLESMSRAMDAMEKLGLHPELVQVQVNVGHALPRGRMLKSRNPVFIIRGVRSSDPPLLKGDA